MSAVLEPAPPQSPAQPNGDNPFYVTGGTLPPSAASYIVRQADTDLYEALNDGQFCYVLNTRQIGKSSLMIRTVRRLKENGAAVVVLDLTAVGQNLNAEQWYDGLLVMLSEQLHLEDECEDFWLENDSLGPMQRFFATLAQVVLPKIGERCLILFVDEIDSVRSLPFSADEFFAGIRECYNRRVQNPVYNRITFCLLGVATPADLITDTRISPFNIGKRVTIGDFSEAEAAPLGQGMGPNGKKLLDRALYWTGGHPYLTQRLCRMIAGENLQSVGDVDKLVDRLFLSKRALDSDDNLSFVQNRMLRSEFPLPDVLDFYGKLRSGKKIKDDETNPLCGLLRLAGIASVDDRSDTLRLRNRIYSTVFDKPWVLRNMPDAELRRQRQAAWAARLQVGSIAAVVIALMAVLSVKLFQTAEDARIAERVAKEQGERSQRSEKRALSAEKTSRENAVKAENNAAEAQRNADRALKNFRAAKRSERLAKSSLEKAIAAKKEAEEQKLRADSEANQARIAKNDAEKQRTTAEKERSTAEKERSTAQKERKRADEQRVTAESQRKRAEDEQRKAVIARTEAETAAVIAQNARAEAENARKAALDSLDKLKESNRKRTQQLRASVEADPKEIAAAVELASIYFQYAGIYGDRENFENAVDANTVVLQRQPGNSRALFERGYCLLKLGRYDEAIVDYSAYIAGRPTDIGEAYMNRATARARKGEYAAALQDLAIVEKQEPARMDYTLRGVCLVALNQYDAAVEAFSRILLKPNPLAAAEGHFLIGDARQRQGDLAAAYAAYGRYREVHPDIVRLYELRVQCLLGLGRYADTVDECQLVERRFQKTREEGVILPYHAQALLYLNDLNGYRALCREAMDRFGGANASAVNANYAAWTCAIGPNGLPDYSSVLAIATRAVAQAEASVTSTPESMEAKNSAWANRNTLAALLYRAGRYREAITELQKCEAILRDFHPDDHFADYIFLALAHGRNGNLAEGKTWLRKARAITKSPNGEQRLFLKEAESVLN